MTRTHAILDQNSRAKKAQKIEYLTNLDASLKGGKMLEVGSGSGFIVSYFSESVYGAQGSYAVDVVDQRQIFGGYNFQLVDDVNLPFPDEKFDFIISNHVIEHVGDNDKQSKHLQEIYRCLQKNGVLYFAVPNRWRIVEPHYKLPFLSWLPEKLASRYLNSTRSITPYDCRPLSRKEAVSILSNAGFDVQDRTLDAIPAVGKLEGNKYLRVITSLPKSFWRIFSFIMPTLIFICRKK